MSSKKEEKAQAAAERIKAAALSAAKGLSRAQAERAAAAAARNVNAYGQKEEGPSRWQERKEAKRQMYLMSTEKAVRLGERKDLKANIASIGGVASQCQKCFQPGHWTYECKNERVYISRPSRSQLLKNPKLRQKMMASYDTDDPDVKGDEEEKKEEKVEKRGKKSKRKYRSDTESSSDSEAPESGSGSDYSSDGSASSYSSSSDSEEERRRRKKKQKGRRKRYSSSSESSDYESSSDSDSDGKSRRKSRKHSRRRK
uniref:CCHC-type domain-containing protein n=1 Tax=Opuntia streptacantha TaxID=393608 RepID=A0A7C9DDI5_OPUST